MYRLSRHKFADGERAAMLVDARGLPLFYPTLFVTTQLRNAGAAVNTIVNKLRDILVLLAWQATHNPPRNLEAEFANAKFLSLADVISIRDYAALDQRYVQKTRPRTPRAPTHFLEAGVSSQNARPTVGSPQHYNRISTIADYVEFLASTITQHMASASVGAEVARMAGQLRKHRPRGVTRKLERKEGEKTPPAELVHRFMRFLDVGCPENPFKDPAVRLRNYIFFNLLCCTGMRRGELLSLRLDRIDLGDEPHVWVIRSQDDPLDPRVDQPNPKSRERPIPIPPDLCRALEDYIFRYRARIGAARKHPYLLVKHRHDDGEGAPLTFSALGTIMSAMRARDPEFRAIHPHAFRHYFNYLLSRSIDQRNAEVKSGGARPDEFITESRELDIRAFVNGHWNKNSGAVYNRRHIQEASASAVMAVQSNLIRKGGGGSRDE